MMTARRLIVVVFAVLFVVSLARYASGAAGEPSLAAFLVRTARFLIIWPLTGALVRFLGGRRPYWSALAAGASTQILGLGFPIDFLGVPWPALGASLALASFFEGFVLVAMATAPPARCFWIAFYVNVVVHVLYGAIYYWSRGAVAVSVLGVALGFGLFILPIFVVDRPLGGAPPR